MNACKKFSTLESGIIAWMIAVCCVQPALAGTQGSYMNSAGYGRAIDSVAFGGAVAKAASPYIRIPCAKVDGGEAPPFDCATTVDLPSGFPGKAYCQSQGFPNYVWNIAASAAGGATCDNQELDIRLNGSLLPGNCAQVAIQTKGVLPDNYTGQITLWGMATPGAAVWVRGFEYTGPKPPEGTVDEQVLAAFIAAVKAQGTPRFDLLLVGPFDYGSELNNDCGLPIPVWTLTGHENLIVIADTLALSIPFEIACAGDVVFQCGDALEYPPVYVVSGGCGEIEAFTVSYDPPPTSLPSGVPTLVTATVTDGEGNQATCSFTATRNALEFEGFFSPIGGYGGECGSPIYTVQRGSRVPVKFRTTCDGTDYSSGNPPTFRVLKCATGQVIAVGAVSFVSNEWHGNWDTDGLEKGYYKLIVTLQDGSERSASIRVK